MKTTPVQLLVNSGSTLTLISYKLCMKEKIMVQPKCNVIVFCLWYSWTQCFLPEGILGQYFLLKYVLKIDYIKLLFYDQYLIPINRWHIYSGLPRRPFISWLIDIQCISVESVVIFLFEEEWSLTNIFYVPS
jgi:hypothetical protein